MSSPGLWGLVAVAGPLVAIGVAVGVLVLVRSDARPTIRPPGGERRDASATLPRCYRRPAARAAPASDAPRLARPLPLLAWQ